MAKIGTAQCDMDIRNRIFTDLLNHNGEYEYVKVNDRQYGVIITDANGEERYARIGVIVAEPRADMKASDVRAQEIAVYVAKQAEKAEKAKAKAEKIAQDKAKREAKAKAQAEKEKGE